MEPDEDRECKESFECIKENIEEPDENPNSGVDPDEDKECKESLEFIRVPYFEPMKRKQSSLGEAMNHYQRA